MIDDGCVGVWVMGDGRWVMGGGVMNRKRVPSSSQGEDDRKSNGWGQETGDRRQETLWTCIVCMDGAGVEIIAPSEQRWKGSFIHYEFLRIDDENFTIQRSVVSVSHQSRKCCC
jgi:hypothetical protein